MFVWIMNCLSLVFVQKLQSLPLFILLFANIKGLKHLYMGSKHHSLHPGKKKKKGNSGCSCKSWQPYRILKLPASLQMKHMVLRPQTVPSGCAKQTCQVYSITNIFVVIRVAIKFPLGICNFEEGG